jgi:serine/threonine protein phosphatase PrpC
MKLRAAGLTHPGLVRSRNEDAYLIDRDLGLFAVADGLGGHPGGQEASQLAIRSLQHLVETVGFGPGAMQRGFEYTHGEVRRDGLQRFPDEGMGTTLTAFLLRDRLLYWGHAGDSSLYRLRDGRLEPLTVEHTLARMYASNAGMEEQAALPSYYAHTLTLCVGLSDEFEPDFGEDSPQIGDRYLLCTDGVIKTLNHLRLTRLLDRQGTPSSLLEDLRDAVLEAGAPDNLTAVLVEILPEK